MNVEISFNTDDDGFLSQECPACEGRFKIIMGEGSPEPISFCPYCAHEGQECWWTPEQVTYIEAAQEKAVNELMTSEMNKMAKKFNRSTGSSGLINLKMSVKSDGPRRTPSPPAEPNLDLSIIEFSCCNERIKHNSSENRLFCVICGTEHQL